MPGKRQEMGRGEIHVCKGYKPKTVHSVRERTDRGP